MKNAVNEQAANGKFVADYFVKEGRSDLAAQAEAKSSAEALIMVADHAVAALGPALEETLASMQALNETARRRGS